MHGRRVLRGKVLGRLRCQRGCWVLYEVYVTFQPNKDAFEPTGGLNVSVSGMTFVGSCPTLIVEGDVN